MAKEKYNWKEIFRKLDEGSSYKDILNEYKGLAPATLSRKYTTYKTTELFVKSKEYTDDAMDRLAISTARNLIEQKKTSFVKRELHKVAKELSITEMVFDNYVQPSIKPWTPKKFLSSVTTKNGTQLFFITDTHYASMELSASIVDFGKMVVENWDGSSKIILVFGGDYIENRHHANQVLSTSSAMNQAVECSGLIAKGIAYILSNTSAKVVTYFLVGNHDEIRQGNEKSGDNLKENIVTMLSKTVELILQKYDNYKTMEYATYELSLVHGGRRFNFRHGHIGQIADKSIQEKMIKDELQTGVTFDHYVVGHFHRWNDWTLKGTTKRFTICPAMKTFDGNFENSRVLRSTVGITMFKENGQASFIPWEGNKKLDGELRNK